MTMNELNTANFAILRHAAHSAAVGGHYKEAQGIFRRLLRLLENAYGRGSTEYNACLKEAAMSLEPTLAKEGN